MSTTITPLTALMVTAENGQGVRTVHRLEPGRSVLVGTSKDCGLRLQGEGLSACHCLLSFEDQTLWVQDWASQAGTLLNGEPIEAKVVVGQGDELRVGGYRLTTAAAASGSGGAWQTAPASSRQIDETEPQEAPEPAAAARLWGADEMLGDNEPLAHEPLAHEPLAHEPLAHEPLASTLGTHDLGTQDLGTHELDRGVARRETRLARTALEQESFEQETIALLREEVELLQEMLAQRDAQLAELNAAFDAPTTRAAAPVEEDESEILLARMEQLLEEAARGDERAVLLEEMLRAAEEANQAEQEERHQLEAWVGDIEHRIAQRDEQRDAELEALRARLDEATEERERAQLQLKQAASADNAPQHYEETLDRLQQQNKTLQEKIAELSRERTTLHQQLNQSGSRDEEALREERVALAQERAIVSRLRSELANKLSALDDTPKPLKPAASDAATRLQALREHLREIHNEEQQAPAEPTHPSLTSRLSRIWKRLEN